MLEPSGSNNRGQVPTNVSRLNGRVPARPAKDEPEHYHLDIGYAFTTAHADVGSIQEAEVTGAAWHQLAEAESLVGSRIARAVSTPARTD